MLKNIKKRNEGFTIIEVLIVLAIAGLILLVVFLAVPALQRNSNNNQRKNDVAAIINAVTEWSNNNGGKLPSSNGTERADALANAKLGFYTESNVSWGSGTTVVNNTTPETVTVVTGAKCASNGDDAVTAGRQIAVLYKVETGNGQGDFICQEG